MIPVADSNAVYYYHYDALGSVVALSDAAKPVMLSSGLLTENVVKHLGGEEKQRRVIVATRILRLLL